MVQINFLSLSATLIVVFIAVAFEMTSGSTVTRPDPKMTEVEKRAYYADTILTALEKRDKYARKMGMSPGSSKPRTGRSTGCPSCSSSANCTDSKCPGCYQGSCI